MTSFLVPCFFISPLTYIFLYTANRMIFEISHQIIWFLSSKPFDYSSSLTGQNPKPLWSLALNHPLSPKLSAKADSLWSWNLPGLFLPQSLLFLLFWHSINTIYSFKFLMHHVENLVYFIFMLTESNINKLSTFIFKVFNALAINGLLLITNDILTNFSSTKYTSVR